MRACAVWFLAASSLALSWPNSAAPQLGKIEQRSEGACSPPIVNNQGQVSISCSGVAEEALRYLESKLSEQFREVSDQLRSSNDFARTIRNLNDLNENLRQQADDWARRYRELSARLAESPDDSAQAKRARELIQRGEFGKAEVILQALATKAEDNVTSAAEYQYDLGDVAMLRFDAAGALPRYEKAFRYRPENPRYAGGYARAAYAERHYAEAERGSIAALQLYRDLAARDPGAYRPDVAVTLNNLGALYWSTGRLAEAEKAYSEALTIYRELAARDPGAYRSNTAAILNNLGVLYGDIGQRAEAEKAFSEALTIRRDLATRNPGAYRPDVAMILNNLGGLYGDTGRWTEAEKAFSEALTIRRDLAARDPGAYRSDVAVTLSNLGIVYGSTGRLPGAEEAYSEALTTYRDLAARDPGAYRPDVANTLNSLGILYDDTGRRAEAEKAFDEALTIRRELAAHDPDPTGAMSP